MIHTDVTEPQDFLVALGGNMPSEAGAPGDTLQAALAALAEAGADIRAVSAFYATPCFPAGAGPDYVNAAARIGAAMTPEAFLALLHRIEARFGRERVRRWGQRTLDLDLVACGDAVLPDADTFAAWRDLDPAAQMERAPETLVLPHPRLQDRAFVLVPLNDVAPEWRHPVLGRTVSEMLDALPAKSRAEVLRLP
ncbi:2-amino-4-hydroxy-6-hydroxymethyldihydropteridine diphosphokinase [Roseovarius aquimarinus]|uniref:2-amino-4-hydroxy-6-hydroxymethyldihydropteridine pyrophosphokinase n=1 Tax=Roseovarius aquimarinus TaxID=1229156 RepID=A0ABW7I6K2_9RHOB